MVRFGWVVVCAVITVLLNAGQSPTPAAVSQQEQPVTTFHTNANLVLVDVVVRDKKKPVEGLKASDFAVLEDGTPEAITTFEEHKPTDVQESVKAPALPPHVYSDRPRYRITSAANVLLLDALNTPLKDQTYARAQMLKYLHTIPAGTEIAVFTLASRLRIVSGFTTNTEAIEQALNLKHTPTQKSLMTDPAGDQAEKAAEQGMAAEIPEMLAEIRDFQQDRRVFQREQRVDITLAAFGQLARFLSTIPGRKNLIWVSGGLPIALDPDMSHMSAEDVVLYAPALRVIHAELARARVAVYPVDARAMMTLTDSNVANVLAPTQSGLLADTGAARAEGVENDITTPQEWGESQIAMDEVAHDTGGAAFYNTNTVGKAVEEAITEGENYYTLGYAPHEARYDGAYHRIAVRLDEGKFNLEYRRGYYAVDPARPDKNLPASFSPITSAMLRGVPPLSQLIYEVRVLPAGDEALDGLKPSPGTAGTPPEPLKAPVTRYVVDYSIDPHGLALNELPDGRKQAEIEVTQAVYDAAAKRVNFSDAGLEVTLTAAQMTRDMRDGLRIRQEIDMPAGNLYFRVGVEDKRSGRIGTVEIPLRQEVASRQ
jgi:VWFA-related protein